MPENAAPPLVLISFASSLGATLAFLISRVLLRDWVQTNFSSQLRAVNDGFAADGAFYLLLPAPWGTGTEFVTRAVQENLLIIPGNVFSSRDTHFRISYAADEATLHRGIEVLQRLAGYALADLAGDRVRLVENAFRGLVEVKDTLRLTAADGAVLAQLHDQATRVDPLEARDAERLGQHPVADVQAEIHGLTPGKVF